MPSLDSVSEETLNKKRKRVVGTKLDFSSFSPSAKKQKISYSTAQEIFEHAVPQQPQTSSEPKIISIDSADPSAFQSLTAALQAAEQNDTILVHPGTYTIESTIVLDKDDLKIVSASQDVGDVKITSSTCKLFDIKANNVLISGFTLLQNSQHVAISLNNLYQNTTIQDCDISCPNGDSCVVIIITQGSTDNTNALKLRRNKIHNCKRTGVLIRQKHFCQKEEVASVAVLLDDNDIFDNTCSNVLVEGRVRSEKKKKIPLFRVPLILIQQSRIYGSQQAGIWIKDYSNVTIQQNEVYNNSLSNIVISTGEAYSHHLLHEVSSDCWTRNVISNNTVYSSQQNGICLRDSSVAIVEHNQIFSNQFPNLYVQGSCKHVHVQYNQIFGGKMGGIYCKDAVAPLIENNEIFGNEFSGLLIEGHAKPTISKNKIYSLPPPAPQTSEQTATDSSGAPSSSSSSQSSLVSGTSQSSTVSGTPPRTSFAPSSSASSSPGKVSHVQQQTITVDISKLVTCQNKGMIIRENSEAIIQENEIHSSKICVEIKGDAAPSLLNNNIHTADECGVWIKNNSKPVLDGNDIYNCGHPCICAYGKSAPVVKNNKVHDSLQSGILLADKASGVWENNEVYGNTVNFKLIGTSNPVIRNNKIYQAKSAGIFARDYSKGTIEGNTFFENKKDNIVVDLKTARTAVGSNSFQ